ncbi:MAG: phosphoadenosine phosphosulfate reductase family protein [Candidatus Peribacteraceae bacterium]|nr:phosphoadenosine phosphosulfate reductase family protein [Candidatus Peribacteraceae bacterium]
MEVRKTHIVALSGGKDSTALAIRLKELNPTTHYIYVCTPTGDELPEMNNHWNNLEDILQQPIIKLHHPEHHTIYDLIEHFQMLPNFRARWCTSILKLETIRYFYNIVKPAIVYVGLRADELKRKGNKLFDDSIKQVFPMQEWGWNKNNVWNYLNKKEITIPRRTDCAMCFYQRLDEWYSLWEQYPERFEKIEDLEFEIGHSLMSPGKHKNWGCWLFELRCAFEKGRMPRAVKKAKNQEKKLTLFKDVKEPFDYSQRGCRVCTL